MKNNNLLEVKKLVSHCIRDPFLSVIIQPSFYEELSEERYFGPLEHYDRIRYDLYEISRIGRKYGKITDGCSIESVNQLDVVLECFYLMDTGRQGIYWDSEKNYINIAYLYIPAFLRKAFLLGRSLS